MEKFKFIDDISDLRFVAYGKTLNELFENCACAMFEGMLAEIKVGENFEHRGNLISENLTDLLHDFLNELLFIFETEHKVFKKFTADIIKKKDSYNLNFAAVGDKSENYVIDVGIKGITYHELSVERKENEGEIFWEANVLCDI
ncbi:MAG: archease [Candidatus Altiarchaeum hamiconexum]|uniref:Archease n=1 Tax=Candidatus Altarchaeum hamiconexum TaxID=1803513 RepID=A0A8J8CIA7_9ARCH|nr:archease [Candidatus Altarchaeum hamiconexum]OIQ06314.1 MAG: hypothetical protein AUK59_00315 [Candidatus Altarchaeum sp. CG2_30_32_3053]PIV28486.1 MAG: hypothetical protein COS36_01960 [Candidatus Altarchaeum sp. CG03_land_8_20_14_0_80_32_618]PIX48780.1 MAG: hypothetical protein COZ53_02855 [Candidatus Altarchaeum sp. CG_4_8_14_3_um_filter_33_2054]PIZ30979.1 MAG: hypothetical protein COY41_03240 [Candidatus Altarchaeum sp. CG_4_10_14_0_8_um_filter_32_851]PJC15308.1 MAG: hypothetical protei